MVFASLDDAQSIYYLRESREIDFLHNTILIQVAYGIEDAKTKERELKAFEEFKQWQNYSHLLITNDENTQIEDIEILSYSRFVLEH